MKITNLGGATAIIEHQGKRILTDPWLDDGIFHGAWYHYPPLSDSISLSNLGRFDYIYISHIHEDHCSIGTLNKLNLDAEVIIADINPNFVEKFLQRNNLNFKKIHKIAPRTPTKISEGMWVDVVEADPANEMSAAIDSALILVWDGFVIYNANDCQPYQNGVKYLLDNYSVDLALLPYSGGSGYPACYQNLSDLDKTRRVLEIQNFRLEHFKNITVEISPRWVMPFADQYVIAGSQSHLNKYVSHPPSPGIVRERYGEHIGDTKVLLLNSLQSYDFETKCYVPDEPYIIFTDKDRDQYISNNLQDKLYEHQLFSLNSSVSFFRLIQFARTRLWLEQKRRNSFPDWTIYIDLPERAERYELNLKLEEIVIKEYDVALNEPFLRVEMASTLAAMILIGHISINIADAALFVNYYRQPDIYNPEIYVLLNLLRC